MLGVRLGGANIINNTPLPGLTWNEDGSRVYFRWKEAMTALLQEEMYMRKVTYKIVSPTIDNFTISSWELTQFFPGVRGES